MWDKRDDMVVHELDPYNAEPPRHALADHPVTPTDAFYTRNHGAVPRIDARGWRLVVDGLVGEALRLSLEDLRGRFGQRTTVATLQCAGNRRTGLLAVRDIPGEAPWGGCATATATWTGSLSATSSPAPGSTMRPRTSLSRPPMWPSTPTPGSRSADRSPWRRRSPARSCWPGT